MRKIFEKPFDKSNASLRNWVSWWHVPQVGRDREGQVTRGIKKKKKAFQISANSFRLVPKLPSLTAELLQLINVVYRH